MKRLFFVAAAALCAGGLAPAAQAGLISTDLVSGDTTNAAGDAPAGSTSTLNPILNKLPGFQGPDQRHICIVSDHVNKSWCFYVAIP